MITLNEAAERLKQQNQIVILSHQSPDGDTLGSAGALCLALTGLGKQVRMECSDEIPSKYSEMLAEVRNPEFEAAYVVAVDVADRKLLGEPLNSRYPRIDLCIDHHGSNTGYAEESYVDASAPAACEIMYSLIDLLGVSVNAAIANCLYTGISTDTGCFRYSSTTPHTMRVAAELMEAGARAAEINRQMFEIKSRSRMELERMALENMEYAFDGTCALMTITREMIRQSGASEGDLEGLAPLPRNVEGVLIGFTLREKQPGVYKVSVRTGREVNASHFCGRLGGGGHPQASGCQPEGTLDEVKQKLLDTAELFLTGKAQ